VRDVGIGTRGGRLTKNRGSPHTSQVEAGRAFGRTIPDVEVPVDQTYFNPPRIMSSFSLTRLSNTTKRLNGQTSRNHNAYRRTSPNEMTPGLPVFPLQFQFSSGDFPIAPREPLRPPPRLVHPLSYAILWKPRQHLVQRRRRV